LTNYKKKLKIAATQQLYKKQKTRKTTNEDIPIFFYNKLFFIYKKTSAIISKYLANINGSLCLY